MTTTGGVTVSNVIAPAAEALAPVVNSQTFTLSTTGSDWVAGKVVGTMTASRSPTSWSITNDSPDYFDISSSGVITVTSAGITALAGATNTTTRTIQATNASGNGAGTATVNYAPTVTLPYPKNFNDPMFTSMVEQSSPLNAVSGTTYNNYSWEDFYGGSVTVWAASNTIFNKLRMQTNEGFRIGGQTNMVINQMYLEVSDPDPLAHADGVQWYTNGTPPPGGGPGSFSSLTIRNSHLRGLSGAYTLMLIADWSCGNITFENCLFTTSRQGCQGFVFNPQNSMLPQTITVSVKDCYVQADDWSDGGAIFDGDCFKINTTTGSPWNIHPCTVSLWQNVNYCTWNHATGVLTPGAAYPKPPGT